MTLDTYRLTVEGEGHTAVSGGSWWSQIHNPHSQPCARPLPWCSWSDRSHFGSHRAAGRGCGWMLPPRVLSMLPGWNCHSCWWLSSAPRSFPFTFPPFLWPDTRLVHWEGRNLRGFFPVVDLTHRVCPSMEAKGHSRFTGNGRCRFSVELWQESCLCQSALQPANGREQPWDSRFFLTHTVVNESFSSFQHYAISYIRKNKLIITSFKIYNKYKEHFKIP